MAPLEVDKSTPPPFRSPSSSVATSDSADSSDDNSVAEVPRSRCKNPGRRLIGGRIYDSILGVTCHWCRQKTVENHVFCCHCTIAFCGGCLKNRHGEDIEIEMKDDVEWTCPKCRGGCGPGCKNCCNCGPCRKAQGLEPTGLLVHTARARGFSNVHDFLIYQKTGECEEIIAKRKRGKGWCQTNPSSFHQKQKRIADDTQVDTGCRKRLSFTSCDTDSRAKKIEKSLQSDTLHIKDVHPASNVSRDEKPCQVGALQTIGHKESNSKSLVPTSEKAMIVQLKPEPDLHAYEEPRSRATVSSSSQGKATNVQLHFQCESRSSPSSQQQRAELDSIPLLHVKAEPVGCDGNSQQSVVVKRELCEPDLQPRHGASCIALDKSLKVKTEEVPSCHETTCEPTLKDKFLSQVKQECLDQSVEIRQEPNARLMLVTEAVNGQCSQPLFDNIAISQPKIFAAKFSQDASDAAWCRSKLNSEFPSENVEGLTSMSASMNSETRRKDCDATCLAIQSASNFHLYPRNPMPALLYAKEADIDYRHAKTTSQLETMSSQEAQCTECSTDPRLPMTIKGGQKGSLHTPIHYPSSDKTASASLVKEEREDGWNAHLPASVAKCTMDISHTSIVPDTVKVKPEREDFSFTIEPVECPSAIKDGRLSMTKVKEEVIDDTPISELICIDDSEAPDVLSKDKPETSAGLKKSSLGSISHLWKMDDFKIKLEAKLAEPFSSKELEKLVTAASHRKPIYKARETRQGCSQFVSEEEGFSYLDHHPDLALQLEKSTSPVFRLSQLRGFFFWLEHASTHGAFKPWTSVLKSGSEKAGENDDCVEIDGPDCEILAVVCSVDEEVPGQNWTMMRTSSGV